MFCAVAIDIVVGTNGLLQLVGDNHARTLCARTTGEHHDSCTSVGISSLVDRKLVAESWKQLEITSRRPTATLTAFPVHLKGRLSFATGHGSRERDSKMPVSWNSTC